MANLLDYLDWRGDLTLAQSPLNEVDNLILAELSFVNFQGIVPAPGEGKSVSLRLAAEAFSPAFRREKPLTWAFWCRRRSRRCCGKWRPPSALETWG